MIRSIETLLVTTALLIGAGGGISPLWADDRGIPIVPDSIGGTVISANGPEAGVWVITETNDLPTRYTKIVVTDDLGRYLLPSLPKAKYAIWTRGYGLVDSEPVEATPGDRIDLLASLAPDAKAAAEYYPAAYWYTLLEPPVASEFPGTGEKGNGISKRMSTQQHWLEHMKENCMFCHQLGNKATRELVSGGDSLEGWDLRVNLTRPDGDPVVHNTGKVLTRDMQTNMGLFGRSRALKMFSSWTDRIAAGTLPKETPPRPSGIERNVVITLMDWGGRRYLHDQISSDHRDPHVNAGGPFYGMAMMHGRLELLDPRTFETSSVPVPGLDGSAHDDTAEVHADEMDSKGRVWMPTAVPSTLASEPDYCKDGSVSFSKYYPLNDHAMAAQLPVYDPSTKKIENIPLCAGGNHAAFAFDEDSTLYLSGDIYVVGWINTRKWDETHDPKESTGWCPMVLDTNGDGKIDPDRSQWVQPRNAFMAESGEGATEQLATAKETAEAAKSKDTQISRYLYGLAAAADGSVWEAAYLPRMRSGLIRLVRGENPPLTCKTEYFEPPLEDGDYAAFGIRSVGVDMNGVAWAAFSSGQVGAFDRRKCKVLNGPSATGQHCPEGWSFYDLPVPQLGNTGVTSDIPYSVWTDWEDVVGLGKGTLFFPTVNSDSVIALPPGQSKFVTFRVPYPMGYYGRGVDFRIDDPKHGWKGKGMHTTYASKVPWHHEAGDDYSKLVSFQLRPDPLAH